MIPSNGKKFNNTDEPANKGFDKPRAIRYVQK
jgi:hypothetical protein